MYQVNGLEAENVFLLQAIDAAADGINSARARLDELNKPGPDYSDTPLTTLSLSPFERREGDEEQVRIILSCTLQHPPYIFCLWVQADPVSVCTLPKVSARLLLFFILGTSTI